MEVRKTTRVRRLLQAVRYDLRPDIPSVPCDAEGNPRVTSFVVSLYKTVGDNVPLLHRTTKLRYRRKESSGRWTAWVDKQDSEAITVPTGLYVQYEIEAYYGGALLTSLGVSTTLDGGMGNKGAQSRVRVWSPNDSYMQGQGTEIWYDISLYREDDTKPYEKYLCLISHGPRNITPKDDVAQGLGYWAVATEYELIATRLMLAERIKAYQIDADGITAKNVNIEGYITATGGSFTGEIIAKSGRIGGWKIIGNNLSCSGFNTKILVEASGTRFLRINDTETVMCSIRADESTGISISTYGGAKTRGLSVHCNGLGYAIESYGAVELHTRGGEYAKVEGLAVRSKIIRNTYTIDSSDDFLIVNNSSNITINMGGSIPGKIIHIKRIGNKTVTLVGKIVYQSQSSYSTTLTLNDHIPRMFIYGDDGNWYESAGKF